MSSELPSQPDPAPPRLAPLEEDRPRLEDEPLDAIVFDVHPALAPAHSVYKYPYGPAGDNPFQVRPEGIYRKPPVFSFQFMEVPADYVVPQRFGLSAILGIMTALAVLFGIMRWLEAHPFWYLFLGAQTVVICLVQMFHGKTPRKASAIAGAILAPLFILGWGSWSRGPNEPGLVLCLVVMAVPFGGFLGYLNGTCAAGIFLVMDKLEPYLQGQRPLIPAWRSSPTLPAS
ncbi:MAG TPA: hypothetical protein VFV87_09780 [Pirellulaceae bacterium]|nr:hypothetical protein [Pirellulaceae bacterium]